MKRSGWPASMNKDPLDGEAPPLDGEGRGWDGVREKAERGRILHPHPTIAAAGSSPGRTKGRPQSHQGGGLSGCGARMKIFGHRFILGIAWRLGLLLLAAFGFAASLARPDLGAARIVAGLLV